MAFVLALKLNENNGQVTAYFFALIFRFNSGLLAFQNFNLILYIHSTICHFFTRSELPIVI